MKISLFSLLSTLFFIACSENKDTAPPQLVDAPAQISSFDTIKVQFDEGLALFDSTSFEAEPAMDCWAVGSEVWCTGAQIYPQTQEQNEDAIGMPTFIADTTYLLTLTNISDGELNRSQSKLEIEFSTYLHIDSDFIDDLGTTNDQRVYADSIGDNAKWLDGSDKSSVFKFSGILEDKNQSGLANDQRDVYFTYLNALDEIKIKLTGNTEGLTLKFVGPIEYGTNQVFQKPEDMLAYAPGGSTLDSLEILINGDRHLLGIDSDEETQLGKLQYWIEVEYTQPPTDIENRPSPYVIEVSVK